MTFCPSLRHFVSRGILSLTKHLVTLSIYFRQNVFFLTQPRPFPNKIKVYTVRAVHDIVGNRIPSTIFLTTPPACVMRELLPPLRQDFSTHFGLKRILDSFPITTQSLPSEIRHNNIILKFNINCISNHSRVQNKLRIRFHTFFGSYIRIRT